MCPSATLSASRGVEMELRNRWATWTQFPLFASKDPLTQAGQQKVLDRVRTS